MKPLFALMTVLLVPALARAQAPKLLFVSPSGVNPGQSVDLKLVGTALTGARLLWSNAPLGATLSPGVDKNGTLPGEVRFRVSPSANLPLGVYGLRVATPGGVSNMVLMAVDDLPTVHESKENKSPATAKTVSLPVAIEGAAESESFDYFKFHAAKGQRIAVEVLGRRLGSPLDAVVRLLDAQGRELAYSDDDDATGADPRFTHTFAAAGDYLLEIRDIRYQGGGAFRYRIRVGEFPLATTPYPLAAQRGAKAKIAITGPAVAGLPTLDVPVPSEAAAARVPLAVKYTSGGSAAVLQLVAGDRPEQVELEPNGKLEEATPIVLTGAINGRLEKNRDRDYFRFEAKKGERYLFTGRTRSLGSPADLFMRMLDKDGKGLAEIDDSGQDEGQLDFSVPADGTYTLMVEDLLNRGAPDHTYRIEIEPYQPGFTLSADADKYDVPRGGTFAVKITAVRRGYTGPITLELDGVAAGKIAAARGTVPEKKNDGAMLITVAETLEPGTCLEFGVLGRATIGKTEVTSRADNLPALRTLFNALPNPPPALDGALAVGVGPVFAPFFELAAEPAVVPYKQGVGQARCVIKAKRLDKFADKIELALESLPAGFEAKITDLDKTKSEATIEITGPKAAAAGEYALRVVGTGKHLYQTGKVVANITLRVEPNEAGKKP